MYIYYTMFVKKYDCLNLLPNIINKKHQTLEIKINRQEGTQLGWYSTHSTPRLPKEKIIKKT